MGFILSKIWGRESTCQQIERIQNEIVSIQEFKRDTQARQDSMSRCLNIFFSLVYALAIILGLIYAKFYYQNPNKDMDFLFKLKIIMGFVLAPLTFIYLKRSLTWWFSRKLNKNEVKLKELREKKTKILHEVTENETLKVAREILEKYAPESLSKYGMVSGYGISSGRPSSSYSSDGGTSLRHRIIPGSSSSSSSSLNTSGGGGGGGGLSSSSLLSSRDSPVTSSSSGSSMTSSRTSLMPASLGGNRPVVPPYQPRAILSGGPSRPQRPPGGHLRPMMRPPMRPPNRMPRGPLFPHPVVPTQKGFLGKIVDYVVGEGPGTRYALICNQCQSHNGMAQEENYEYTAYRCCYCNYWNPAKKQKPIAPKLVLPEPEVQYNEKSAPGSETKETDSKTTKEGGKDSSLASKEEVLASSNTSDDSSSKSSKSEDESHKFETNEPAPEESSIVLSNNMNESEEKVTESENRDEGINLKTQETATAEEDASIESKSDIESDIDIIDNDEALEAMEIDENSKSNIDDTSDKIVEIVEKEE